MGKVTLRSNNCGYSYFTRKVTVGIVTLRNSNCGYSYFKK